MVMTLEADYAVRIVEYLTKHGERRDAKKISEETQIPLRFSLKILRELVAEGMVCSFKGAKGGYTLAKPPEEITLRQVIESVEGPYMLSRCQRRSTAAAETTAGCTPSMNAFRKMCAGSWTPIPSP